MSVEVFQLIYDTKIDISILKTELEKYIIEKELNWNEKMQIQIFFGENNNYHQIGNAYRQCDITVKKLLFFWVVRIFLKWQVSLLLTLSKMVPFQPQEDQIWKLKNCGSYFNNYSSF